MEVESDLVCIVELHNFELNVLFFILYTAFCDAIDLTGTFNYIEVVLIIILIFFILVLNSILLFFQVQRTQIGVADYQMNVSLGRRLPRVHVESPLQVVDLKVSAIAGESGFLNSVLFIAWGSVYFILH